MLERTTWHIGYWQQFITKDIREGEIIIDEINHSGQAGLTSVNFFSHRAMNVNPLIRKMECHALLSDEEKGAINAICAERVQKFPARRDIISDGQATNFVHLIIEGWAARYKIMPDGSRQITAFLIAGDFCDLHITILEKMDHGILALTPCKVAHLDTDKLDEITDRANDTDQGALVDDAGR